MTAPGVYLDHCATSPLRPEARAAMTAAFDVVGNPSSVHADGRAARALLEQARGQVASLAGAKPASVTFTSGGTEANVLAVRSAVAAGSRRLLVSAIEHDCVREAALASGVEVVELPVLASGVIDLEALRAALDAGPSAAGPVFLSLMAANNETGVIQPVREAGERVRAAGGWLHVDAVQAAGRLPVGLDLYCADTLALSAHKLGGPQGIGALIAGPRSRIVRDLPGGGQEQGRRAGTQNLIGAAGFGAAAAAALAAEPAGPQARDMAAERLTEAGARVVGADAPRLADVLCIAAPDMSSEIQVMGLDLAGVRVSAGAACSSGKVKPSRVLEAMGMGELAGRAIRLSGGWSTGPEDWRIAAEAWIDLKTRREARRHPAAA
ncbi:cysteine desulfurase family protein [Phenylobacterium sp.]|uniref:cysteine desulfurase family protein n=1 Tax=Phenylobacterium sp. TaxID=1871053 RepID=UPI0025E34499|nr:cysteine desulfurase family protein [Phenylobacterium sp.]MCA6288946.1 cysteine desulfurase [Phenylobacterium sp.]MCA6310023.1 cysteine desulfurase [Phenylobacterium sp.]MCA6322495.1 cysteine desulfurase [Phenylobacterium sp.]MCA6335867.1 cysteine desulfurase [Phenylobacterium sp.]MCA6338611.1 cysteine desulfurase [Phenylobacterium sp.]